MSIVIAKKIDGKIVLCSDSASFRGSKRVSNNVKKIHKITDNIYFAGVGGVSDTMNFMDKFKSFYEVNEINVENQFVPAKIPNEQDLRDMLLSIYSVMNEEKLLTESTNINLIIAIERDVYSCIFTKEQLEITRTDEDELLRGIAIGMYTENIQLLLDYMSPSETIKAIYNDGGIYINDIVQEIVI